MKAISRVLIAMVAAIAALFVSTGTSHRGLEYEMSLVDGQARTMTIQQWDTFLNGVFPLDRNRLTREWFHSGSAVYDVAGAGADAFEGTLELGYQIGFPWSLGVGINFSYTTPNILLDDVSLFPVFNPLGSVITPNLFPGVSISADLGNGPGIQEVATFTLDEHTSDLQAPHYHVRRIVLGTNGCVMSHHIGHLHDRGRHRPNYYRVPQE